MVSKSMDTQVYTFFQAVTLVTALVTLLSVLRGTGTFGNMSEALTNFMSATTKAFVAKLPSYLVQFI